jgi:hypothetical protein
LGDSINDIETIKEVITFIVYEDFKYEIVNRLNFKINKVFHENIQWEFTDI